MPRPTLSKGAVKLIHSAIEELFNRTKARILGLNFFKPPKRIYITTDPNFSLPGLFASASIEERNKPNTELLDSLLRIAEGYIDAQKASTQTHIVKSIESFLQDAYQKGTKTDVKKVLGGELENIWAKTTDAMHRIVNTEANQVKNIGVLDGIVKVNASAGINDPVMAFLGVNDEYLCDECKRLFLLEDQTTPRCWYLSEIGNGYHKKGEDTPKMGGLHPHCRHTPISVMPGYGFKNGFLEYIAPGHNEIEKQRRMEKSESDLPDLFKSTRSGVHTFESLKPHYIENAGKYGDPPENRLSFLSKFRDGKLTINFSPHRLPEMIGLGRLKNSLEGGLPADARSQRIAYEESSLGIPKNTLNSERPVYGALVHPDSKIRYATGGAPEYGRAYFLLKPEVKSRSSYTVGDSFGYGHPVTLNHIERIANKHVDNTTWMEAQIHGGVYFNKDIEELHLHMPFTHPLYGTSTTEDEEKRHGILFGERYNIPVFFHKGKDPSHFRHLGLHHILLYPTVDPHGPRVLNMEWMTTQLHSPKRP